jgi:hypothetical protein
MRVAMTAPAATPETPPPAPEARNPQGEGSEDVVAAGRVGTMRGATVQMDLHRVLEVTVGVVLVTLAVLVVVFTVAGVRSNNQIDELHNRGVPVTVTVTDCLGLLGGSGSNPAGYSCHGTYVLGGHRYTQSLPGLTHQHPGAQIAGVAVPDDPSLMSLVSALKTQHSSAGAFILPVVLGVLLLALIGVVVWRTRRARHAADGAA